MTEFFWELFKKSGNIDAFMAYKEYSILNIGENNKIEKTGNEENEHI